MLDNINSYSTMWKTVSYPWDKNGDISRTFYLFKVIQQIYKNS